MKFTVEERALLTAALKVAQEQTSEQVVKWRYHSLRTKIERAQRTHLSLVKSNPPDDAA